MSAIKIKPKIAPSSTINKDEVYNWNINLISTVPIEMITNDANNPPSESLIYLIQNRVHTKHLDQF